MINEITCLDRQQTWLQKKILHPLCLFFPTKIYSNFCRSLLHKRPQKYLLRGKGAPPLEQLLDLEPEEIYLWSLVLVEMWQVVLLEFATSTAKIATSKFNSQYCHIASSTAPPTAVQAAPLQLVAPAALTQVCLPTASAYPLLVHYCCTLYIWQSVNWISKRAKEWYFISLAPL